MSDDYPFEPYDEAKYLKDKADFNAWLQVQLPMADFSTWDVKELEAFKEITASHCCSVCGRWDDDGCIDGC